MSYKSWWQILNDPKYKIPGLPYDSEKKFLYELTKIRSSDEVSFGIIILALEKKTPIPFQELSTFARHWLETHGLDL
jgi:hypothetical protein